MSRLEQIAISRNGLINSMGEYLFAAKKDPCYCEFTDTGGLKNESLYASADRLTPLGLYSDADRYVCHYSRDETYVYLRLREEEDLAKKGFQFAIWHIKLKVEKEYHGRVVIFDDKQLFFINDSVTLKIPFLVKTHKEIEDALQKNKIPWGIFSAEGEVKKEDIMKALTASEIKVF